jgi:hypothetical protein
MVGTCIFMEMPYNDKPAEIILPVDTRLPVLLNVLSAANVLATRNVRPMSGARSAANIQSHLRPAQGRGHPFARISVLLEPAGSHPHTNPSLMPTRLPF